MALFAVRRVHLPLCSYSSADTAGGAQGAGEVSVEKVVDLSVPVDEVRLVVSKARLADAPRDEFAAHLCAAPRAYGSLRPHEPVGCWPWN